MNAKYDSTESSFPYTGGWATIFEWFFG